MIFYPVYPIYFLPPKSHRPNKPVKKEKSSEISREIRQINKQTFPEFRIKAPRKNTLVSDEETFQYMESYNVTQTREFFCVSSYRINRILSEKKGTKIRKRKTTNEIDEFIVETAASEIFMQKILLD